MTSFKISLRFTTATIFGLFATGTLTPALAAIDNTATASGTYNAGITTSAPDSATVPVAPATPALSVSKTAGTITTAGGSNTSIVDAGDTITYTYVVQNTGNVTVSGVTPVDSGPTFGGSAGTGTMGTFSLTSGTLPLLPGASATFQANYTLSALDVYRAAGTTNAVSNTATATGNPPTGPAVSSPPDTADTTIPAGPELTIVKAASLDDTNGSVAGQAEEGETITYTYTITNTGNVALTGVSVSDTHEGVALLPSVFTGESLSTEGPLGTPASTDATANDGVWDTLQPGAVITITYVHIVTQPEFDAQ